MKHKQMPVGAHLPFHCSKGTNSIDACVNFAGREWDRGLPVGTGNPLQRSVLYVQADGESFCVCVCVWLCECVLVFEREEISFGEVLLLWMQDTRK